MDGSYTQEMKEQGEEKLDVLVPHLDSNRSAVQKYLGGSRSDEIDKMRLPPSG